MVLGVLVEVRGSEGSVGILADSEVESSEWRSAESVYDGLGR